MMHREFNIKNKLRSIEPVRLSNDVSRLIAIVGITNETQSIEEEVEKAKMCTDLGVSIIADVSTLQIGEMQCALMGHVDVPLSTVPMYEIYREAKKHDVWKGKIPKELVLKVVERQAARGVDCVTIHASLKREMMEEIARSRRRIRIQGRGGGLIFEYIRATGNENPLYEYFDDILEILSKYEIALSLGNCLRTGTVDDPIDGLVEREISCWKELSSRSYECGVDAMVEGASHLRMSEIGPYVEDVSQKCDGAPVRILGPIATERGLGYDHITGAISAVEAIKGGAALITIVTRAEHIGLPNLDDLREAVIAFRIATELARQPSERGGPETDFSCGLGFQALNADDFFDLERAVQMKRDKNRGSVVACSMCAELCRMRLSGKNVVDRKTLTKKV